MRPSPSQEPACSHDRASGLPASRALQPATPARASAPRAAAAARYGATSGWAWSRNGRGRARRGPAQGAPRACACACDEALARERLREAGLRAPQNRLSPLEFLLRAPTDRPSVRLSIRLGRRDGGTGSTPPWAIGQNCSLSERTHMGCGPGCKSSKQVTPRKLSSTSARGGCAWS